MTDQASTDLGSRLYASYDGWKGWKAPFVCDADTAGYFAAELAAFPVTDRRILEIGFGNGEFLAWARNKGAVVSGCEVTPAAVAAAEAAGIPLISPDFETDPAAHGHFDIIAAFDVFEHLDPPTIVAKLAAIGRMLNPTGILLLRYPNGQSPYGLASQNGDATHVTALSRAKIEQYATGTGLETVRYGGVARGSAPSAAKACVRAIRYALRNLHRRVIHFVYATDVELEPVVTHVLARSTGADTDITRG
jgi:SAM-dependent methyltransferase